MYYQIHLKTDIERLYPRGAASAALFVYNSRRSASWAMASTMQLHYVSRTSVSRWILLSILLRRVPTSEAQTLFQSGWFIEGLLSQTLIVHMIRTRRIPFVQSNAAWPLMLMTFAIMAIGIAIPFTSFGTYIGLMPLPLSYFPWLIAILLSYCMLTQGIKQWYIKKFGKWL